MFKSIVTATSFAAMAIVALVAGVAVFSSPVVPVAEAASQVKGALHQPRAKADGVPALMKDACALRSWPHYDQNCKFDLRRPAGEALAVRVIGFP